MAYQDEVLGGDIYYFGPIHFTGQLHQFDIEEGLAKRFVIEENFSKGESISTVKKTATTAPPQQLRYREPTQNQKPQDSIE